MNHLGLFEGIGGFSLAARWAGWETSGWVEINPFCQKALKYHFPEAQGFSDIKKFSYAVFKSILRNRGIRDRRVDIITGGFPCQPYSLAGKRKGTDDDRHLWPYMLETIRQFKPTWVVGENVRGITNWNGGLVFEQVQADLEAIGYEVQAFVLPACAVDAPHRRDRVWFIAYSGSFRSSVPIQQWRQNTASNFNVSREIKKRTTSDTMPTQREREVGGVESKFVAGCEFVIAYPHSNQRCQGRMYEVRRISTERYTSPCGAWAMGNWENFPTQSPLCGRNDGFSTRLAGITVSKHRNESIKAYGNAIVPQLALQIFQAINQYKNEQRKIQH